MEMDLINNKIKNLYILIQYLVKTKYILGYYYDKNLIQLANHLIQKNTIIGSKIISSNRVTRK
jgi:hypothetical protein